VSPCRSVLTPVTALLHGYTTILVLNTTVCHRILCICQLQTLWPPSANRSPPGLDICEHSYVLQACSSLGFAALHGMQHQRPVLLLMLLIQAKAILEKRYGQRVHLKCGNSLQTVPALESSMRGKCDIINVDGGHHVPSLCSMPFPPTCLPQQQTPRRNSSPCTTFSTLLRCPTTAQSCWCARASSFGHQIYLAFPHMPITKVDDTNCPAGRFHCESVDQVLQPAFL
jgi:hypothetical protein